MRFLSLFFGISVSLISFSQSRTISKVKEDFAAGNYAAGLERLNTLTKGTEEQVLSQYFKAYYFGLTANPKFSLDSAYVALSLSEQQYATLAEKEQTGLCEAYGICKSRFPLYKDSLTQVMFSSLVQLKDLAGLQKFCLTYPKASNYAQAVVKVEELRFDQAIAANEITVLESFLKDYPTSKYGSKVKDLLEKLKYEKALKLNSIAAYELFLKEYKDSKFKKDVLDRIELISYNDAKTVHSIAIYKSFLTQFPSSKYRTEIDSIVYVMGYESVLAKNDITSIEDFLKEYPNRQYTQKLTQLLEEKYYTRAKSSPTKEYLEAYCEKFNNPSQRLSELSLLLENLYFTEASTLNTKEQWLLFISKFPNSTQLKEAKIALADLFTIAPYLLASGRMEYRDIQTKTRQYNRDFEFAYPFSDGLAIVQDNGLYGLINDQGKMIINLTFHNLKPFFENKLYIASKRKPETEKYWKGTSAGLFNSEWSTSDISQLNTELSTISSYLIETPQELAAFRNCLGAFITEQYYSFSNYSYGKDGQKFDELKEKALETFNAQDHYIYIFGEGPFYQKFVEDYEAFEGTSRIVYTLKEKTYFLEYREGKICDNGSTDHFIVYENSSVKIIREGYMFTDETSNPGDFYLQATNGTRLTKTPYNNMSEIGSKGEYFLCHQGGEYQPNIGDSWDLVGGKWGVVNKNGQVVLPLIFDELYPVDSFDVHPYFISIINKVWPAEYNDYQETLGNSGLIDLEGKEIVPYADGYNVIEFRSPNTIIVTKNAVLGYYENSIDGEWYPIGGLSGVIDINRKILLPVVYNSIYPINNEKQFIAIKGQKVLPDKEYPGSFKLISTGKYYLMGRNNQSLLATPLDYLSTDLSGCLGCSVTYYEEAYNGKWGIINEKGQTVVPFNYSEINSSYNINAKDVHVVLTGRSYKKENYGGFDIVTEGKKGLIRNGTLMTPISYNEIDFGDHFISAQIGKTTSFFQLNCQPIPLSCEDLLELTIGTESIPFYAYRIGPKWGLANNKFEKLTEPIFWGTINGENNNSPFSYSNGYFLVDQGGLKYYVTRKGQVLKD